MGFRNLRRAAHEAVDILLDALEADLRATGEDAPLPPRKARRQPRHVPPPDPSLTTDAMRAEMSKRL